MLLRAGRRRRWLCCRSHHKSKKLPNQVNEEHTVAEGGSGLSELFWLDALVLYEELNATLLCMRKFSHFSAVWL
jgi:hypothetical protein